MSEPPDLQALASRYLDLWQQQLGAIAEDDQAADVMARTMDLMNVNAAAFAAMAAFQAPPAGAQTQTDTQERDQPNADAHTPAAGKSGQRGPAAAAAASRPSDHDLAELSRRLERLEKRVASLEGGSKKSR